MKKLLTVVTTVALGVSLLQAQDKDYGVSVEANDTNKVLVSISSKTIPVRDANVKLKLYNTNDNTQSFQTNTVSQNNNYVFDVKSATAGTYNYVVSFNRLGGVMHYRKGEITLH